MISKYHRKEKFQKYFEKFEKCNSKKNYYKLTNFLLTKVVKLSGIIKDFKLLMTDKNNVLFFNSELGNKNTYDKYKCGKINYNNKVEEKINDRSEKYGHGFVKIKKKVFFSLKIGSSFNISYIEEEEETNQTTQIVSASITFVIFLIFVAYFGGLFEVEALLEDGDITNSRTSLDAPGKVVTDLSNALSGEDEETVENLTFEANKQFRSARLLSNNESVFEELTDEERMITLLEDYDEIIKLL